jgi:flavin-dependent dehydrogenase
VARDDQEVLIVGGGAAGCVLARRLADVGLAVRLLEAGPDLGDRTAPALNDGWPNPQGPDWTAVPLNAWSGRAAGRSCSMSGARTQTS